MPEIFNQASRGRGKSNRDFPPIDSRSKQCGNDKGEVSFPGIHSGQALKSFIRNLGVV